MEEVIETYNKLFWWIQIQEPDENSETIINKIIKSAEEEISLNDSIAMDLELTDEENGVPLQQESFANEYRKVSGIYAQVILYAKLQLKVLHRYGTTIKWAVREYIAKKQGSPENQIKNILQDLGEPVIQENIDRMREIIRKSSFVKIHTREIKYLLKLK